MIGAGDAEREPNGLLTGDAALSLLSCGDEVPESEPEEETEASSVPSLPATGLDVSDFVLLRCGGDEACLPEPDVN